MALTQRVRPAPPVHTAWPAACHRVVTVRAVRAASRLQVAAPLLLAVLVLQVHTACRAARCRAAAGCAGPAATRLLAAARAPRALLVLRGRTTRTVPRRRRTRAWRVLRARFVERDATRRPGAGCARRAATRQWAAASTRRARFVSSERLLQQPGCLDVIHAISVSYRIMLVLILVPSALMASSTAAIIHCAKSCARQVVFSMLQLRNAIYVRREPLVLVSMQTGAAMHATKVGLQKTQAQSYAHPVLLGLQIVSTVFLVCPAL